MKFSTKLTKAWRVAKIVSAVLPMVVTTMKVVEKELKQSGLGAEKLERVRVAVESFVALFDDTLVTFDDVWAVLTPLINSMVTLFNAFGWNDDDDNGQDQGTDDIS